MENKEGEIIFPRMKWAESKDRVYITIQINEATEAKLDITQGSHLIFSCKSNNLKYGFDFELYKEVDRTESKWNTNTRNIFINLKKINEKEPFWNFLRKDKNKNNIFTDWDLYQEEEEKRVRKNLDLDQFNKGQGFKSLDTIQVMNNSSIDDKNELNELKGDKENTTINKKEVNNKNSNPEDDETFDFGKLTSKSHHKNNGNNKDNKNNMEINAQELKDLGLEV